MKLQLTSVYPWFPVSGLVWGWEWFPVSVQLLGSLIETTCQQICVQCGWGESQGPVFCSNVTECRKLHGKRRKINMLMFDVNSKVCLLLGRLGECMNWSTGLLQAGQDKTRKRTRGNISDGTICLVTFLLVSSSLTLHEWINRIEWGKILNLYIKFSRINPSETASKFLC